MTDSKTLRQDLDATVSYQVGEIVRLLEVSVAQLERAMAEGDLSVESLLGVVTEVGGELQAARAGGDALAGAVPGEGASPELIGQLLSRLQRAVVELQFYDRLRQRLAHVHNSLDQLAQIIGDPGRLASPEAWSELKAQIRSTYAMEEERQIFDALMSGGSGEDLKRHREAEPAEAGGIELF